MLKHSTATISRRGHIYIKHSKRSIQWLCNSQGFRTPWWWLRL